ncbi:hypothetical protein FNU76_04865 [Chitinimonas arctica]|uniref:Uncharacterized protein n=1 Tax=Chitinimonas arctica TaxID=2594795 RepID=A0A516SC66_9NEIS|nr:hypothetical protein [Chitinimonas arctica]QDQ25734.1 hypothetical protein FNU76_04865 [Chitinimonas arctica]
MENDVSLEERAAVEAYFGEPAIFLSKSEFMAGRLVFWKNAESFPTIRACSFRRRNGDVLVPNEGEDFFRGTLFEIGAEIKDADHWCKLIERTSPGVRQSIKKLLPYMKDIQSSWHLPIETGEGFDAFFDNYSTGRLERIGMKRGAALRIEDVGAGMELHLH